MKPVESSLSGGVNVCGGRCSCFAIKHFLYRFLRGALLKVHVWATQR